jgi:hypothetical protein
LAHCGGVPALECLPSSTSIALTDAQMHQQQETRTGMVILSFISLAAPARRGHCKAGR